LQICKSETKNSFSFGNVSNAKNGDKMKDMNGSETARTKIANALEECLQTKRLEKVTVAEIMRTANMTRQMFYHYFQDINELVYWMHNRHTLHHTAKFSEKKSFVETFGNALAEMREYKEFYKNIITYQEYPTFADSFYQEVIEDVAHYIGKGRIDEELEFSLKIYWHGATDMLVDWIKNDMKCPPDIMAKRFYENMPKRLAKYYD